MKKLIVLLMGILLVTSVCPQVFATENTEVKHEIKAFQVPAIINYTTAGYENASLTGYVTTIEKGTWVEYMNPDSSSSMSKARIKLGTGEICWVPMSAVYVSRYDYTIEDTLTDADREAFVNDGGYTSKTPYLIWVSKERQRLTVFLGSEGNWKAINTFPVATGKNTTPTPTTVCEYTYKTAWYSTGYVCNPVLYLYNGYAIHNQPTSYSGYVLDKTIGHPASAGCIRMLQSDVNWVCYYVPVGTTVILH
ncbi:MAG: L,D-transpeptidase [Clostridia bacterium]|nr:L,D-transpeptidase [Clostridia bacterium]